MCNGQIACWALVHAALMPGAVGCQDFFQHRFSYSGVRAIWRERAFDLPQVLPLRSFAPLDSRGRLSLRGRWWFPDRGAGLAAELRSAGQPGAAVPTWGMVVSRSRCARLDGSETRPYVGRDWLRSFALLDSRGRLFLRGRWWMGIRKIQPQGGELFISEARRTDSGKSSMRKRIRACELWEES